ncbi:MAG TPA: autotransporter-associated beta strand repeat-containing protein [Tepidisphaeraceae bacterium]|jgi:autotransporter-associated beta strand protein
MSLKLSPRSSNPRTSKSRIHRALAGIVVLPALSALVPTVQAANKYWDPNGATPGAGAAPGGNWDTTTSNWSTDSTGSVAGTTWAANDTAIFSAGSDATGAYTVTLSGSQSAAGIKIEEGTLSLSTGTLSLGTSTSSQINSGAKLVIDSSVRTSALAGASITLDGGSIGNTNTGAGSGFLATNLGIALTANGGSVDVAGATQILLYSGTVSGAGTLTKTGAGEYRAVAGSYSKLNVAGGLFRINSTGSDTAFGAAPAAPLSDAITLNGTAIGTSVNVSTNVNRGMTLGANGGGIILNATMSFNGNISGTGGLTLNNFSNFTGVATQTLRLAGTNTYGGDTTINSATLVAAGGNAIPDASTVILPTNASATATFNASASETIGGLSGGAGGFGVVTIGGASSVILSAGANNASTTFSGAVSGSGGFSKVGTGTLTIQGNDWANTGTNSIVGGTIKFGNSLAGFSNSSTLSIGPSGTLDMNNINDTFGALSGSGAIINGGNITTAANTSTTFAGTYQGTGVLNKGGTGVLTLNSTNNFPTINLNAGRINFNSNGAGGAGSINVANASGIQLTSTAVGVNLPNNIAIAGTGANSVLMYATSGNQLTLSGIISGAGSILRDATGGGSLALAGDNSFTGGVQITNRDLGIGHKHGLGTGTLTVGDAVTAPTTPIALQATTPLIGTDAIANPVTVNQNFGIGGSSDIEFSGPVTLVGTSRTLSVTNTADSVLSGNITSSTPGAAFYKDGTGTLIFSGNSSNSYTGPTFISAGRLKLSKSSATALGGEVIVGDNTVPAGGGDFLTYGGSNQVADTSLVTLNGGTVEMADNSDTVGGLNLLNSSAIDLGAGSTSILAFGDSSTWAWNSSAVLNILNWSGSDSGGGTEAIKFGSNSPGLGEVQLAQIFFVNPAGHDPGTYPATFSASDPSEIVPLVPEPTSLGLMAGAGLLMSRRRRKA